MTRALEVRDTVVMRPVDGFDPLDEVQSQSLWLAAHKQAWRSLAILPGDPSVSSLEAANSLARIAWWYSGQPTCVTDLRDVSLRMVEHQLAKIEEQTADGELV